MQALPHKLWAHPHNVLPHKLEDTLGGQGNGRALITLSSLSSPYYGGYVCTAGVKRFRCEAHLVETVKVRGLLSWTGPG